MISNTVNGTVEVSNSNDDITSFQPQTNSVSITSGSPSIGA